jgi:hypothetical protein
LAAEAEKKPQPVWERLAPPDRAKLLMVLLGLVLLGLMLVVLVVAGGRYVRRLSRAGLEKTAPRDDNWYRKPLVPAEPDDESPDDAADESADDERFP